MDYAASRGEYLNGILMADYLGYEFIDSATVIFLMKKEIWMQTRLTRYCQRNFQNVKSCHSGIYGIGADGRVKHSPAAVRILPGPLLQKHVMQVYMRTGQMYPDVS